MTDAQPAASGRTTEARARLFKALGDPNRVRIVELLGPRGETSGSDIAEAVGMSLALLSHHLKILADAGVIHTRKEGQTRYVRLNEGAIICACRDLTGGPPPPPDPGATAG
ncbi:MAG: transcription regulator ArsR [Gemmatimonadetes bacterium]|nr:transcription regulator ArsR [Gemmatimonadota bacterium]